MNAPPPDDPAALAPGHADALASSDEAAPPRELPAALPTDMLALARALRYSRGPRGGPATGIAVARLFPDLSLADWEALLESSGEEELKDWIALPLGADEDADVFPFLAHLQRQLEELAWQTDHDALTGLHNRRAFDRLLHQELNRSQRQSTRLALAVIDLDNFKRINDTHGHPVGDTVLKALAEVLSRSKRGYDVAARTGGEEFSLLLPGAGANRARAMLERLLETFAATPFTDESGQTVFHATFSAGLALTRGASRMSPREFVTLADQALYDAKRQGRRRVVSAQAPEEVHLARATLVQSDEKRFLFSGPSGAGLFDDDDSDSFSTESPAEDA